MLRYPKVATARCSCFDTSLNEQLLEVAISVAYRWALDREIATKQLFVGKGALPRVHAAHAQSGGDVTHTHQANAASTTIPPSRGEFLRSWA
jgi:hypothetical protein